MKNLWIITLISLLMTSCRPGIINIEQATKQTVFPGIKDAPLSIKYTVRFKLLKPTQLANIHFKNANTTFEIKRFLLKNLDTKDRYDAHKTLPVGNYIFEASTLKKYDYKVKLQQGENIYMP